MQYIFLGSSKRESKEKVAREGGEVLFYPACFLKLCKNLLIFFQHSFSEVFVLLEISLTERTVRDVWGTGAGSEVQLRFLFFLKQDRLDVWGRKPVKEREK